MNFRVRRARPEDHSPACDIGTACYPENYYEGERSFFSKMSNSPDGCFVAETGRIIGYIISFPYYDGVPFPIDQEYERPMSPDCLYIHDVCVLPEFRKLSVASSLVGSVLSSSGKFRLTAVENSERFWGGFGFRAIKKFMYCGREASYMGLEK